MKTSPTPENVRAALREIERRGKENSIDPGAVARDLVGSDPDAWGKLMKPLRAVFLQMARDGEVELLRKGKPVAPEDLHGVYRLRVVELRSRT
ncbi:DUF3253 domain-containing protein [Pseudohoeflea suaedae]|uniref:DUF3253 domain-containing protein n=1 Tax=Pseudohoeflea suaedae TaxID=877384 RepID=A0A4R5PKC7_9HYPH|nr:DUF3253 domain-containing protein [Pseudohoeflea suaedae]TDH36160.1 DUF3253 domain-containing protein [Pseudohoeflea suaedae]